MKIKSDKKIKTKTKVKEVLMFLKDSKGIEGAERYGASLSNFKNTVAEHSWRLGLMVLVITKEFDLKLNISHALAIALFHDLAEGKTGDMDAYIQIKKGKDFILDKHKTENIVMKEMTKNVSFGKYVYDLFLEYEKGETVEAKFVRALDSIEGFLHIFEVGVENYIPKEFHGNYADKAINIISEVGENFPALKELLEEIKENLKKEFKKVNVKWVE